MLSDLLEIPKMFSEIKFELGEPLKPFEQLMGCLPPASGQLVPEHYRSLMTSPESPIIQFYPTNFRVDMNGKKYVLRRWSRHCQNFTHLPLILAEIPGKESTSCLSLTLTF